MPDRLDAAIDALIAIAKRDAKITLLRKRGWGLRRIAAEVGVSYQRVDQILKRKVSK